MLIILVCGILLSILVSLQYYFFGYSLLILILWLFSLLLTSFYFFIHRSKDEFKVYDGKDTLVIFGLLCLFTPLYLILVYQFPVQVSSDEIAHMFFIKKFAAQSSLNFFETSGYWYFPAGIFILLGKLANLFGGVSLLTMRTIFGAFGLGTILLCYLYFRLFRSKLTAFASAVVVGASHTMLGLNRMVFVNNLALPFSLSALIFLYYGFKKRCFFYTLLGSFIAGFSFYNYYSARVVVALWLLFLINMAIFFRKEFAFSFLIKLLLVFLLGVFQVVNLSAIASFIKPDNYAREQFLIFPEGQKLQQDWVRAKSISDGIKINLLNGLTAFNNKVHDFGYLYVNYNHGFVDPLTGILIWIGFITIILRRRKGEEFVLNLGSFLFLWLLLALFITKSPNYSRLMMIFPFIAFLTIEAIGNLSFCINKILDKLNLQGLTRYSNIIIITFFILVIFLLNLNIYKEYIYAGITNGDDIGGTARYVEARKNIETYAYYLVTSDNYPYYSWGYPEGLITRVEIFLGKNQSVKLLSSENFTDQIIQKPFSIFLSKPLWLKSQPAFIAKYANFAIHNIKPDGSLVAIEVN